jgi:hypothetical protein
MLASFHGKLTTTIGVIVYLFSADLSATSEASQGDFEIRKNADEGG